MEKSNIQRRSERRLPPPPKVAPWLVFPHGKDGKFQTFCNLIDDDELNKKASNKFIPELSKRTFWQKNCHNGWIVIVRKDDASLVCNYGDCFLWNPESLETIQLPFLLEDDYWIKDCLLTSPPQSSTSSSSSSSNSSNNCRENDDHDDSMVYILFDGRYERRDFLLFCHPGEKEWRKHEFDDLHIYPVSMLYVRSKLHIICSNGVYLEIEVRSGSGIDDEESLAVTKSIVSLDGISTKYVCGGLGGPVKQYYVESFGEVFRIRICSISRGIYHQHYVDQIDIIKLDFSSMAWVDVKSLDDNVFFLSSGTQLSCSASDLGFSKGCVYYTQHEEMSFYKYDLEDQSILLSLPCPHLPTPWFLPQWLMISAPPRVNDRRRTTDCILGKVEDMDKSIKIMENITSIARDDGKEDLEEVEQEIMPIDDLVWSVSNYLHTLDYINLRAVSKRYHAMMNLRRSCSSATVQTTDLSPWLVSSNFDRSVYNFVNPLHNNEKYLVSIPEMVKGSRICFSKGGWLLMLNGLTLFFHNPFTRSSIKLPDLPDDYEGHFSGISFSSLPTSADCVVFAIHKPVNASVSIFFIERGEEHWRYNSFDGTCLPQDKKDVEFDADLNNPVFYNGAFYCLDLNGNLGVSKQEEYNISWEVLGTVTQPNCAFIYKSYLVECEGKLVCVLLGHMGKWVRIYRLNDARMVWVEIKDLGKHMLCVSNTSCISAVAPVSEMENKIFFPRLHEDGILFYSLDTGMYHSVGTTGHSKDHRDTKVKLHCSWIEPNWSETSDQFLDWLSV